jgi:conjugal transfer/entry exclusion protein
LLQESYSKLEFAMAEAESYANDKVVQLEEALAASKEEKDTATARIQNDVDAANEQLQAKCNELESLRAELVELVCRGSPV